eukprot:CAMPEP_0198559030 /NCGR_PEP_ID=MMETSP1462-20131121/91589_1 /TAXON_ID=1333877 /ORGANISM="Brandtodinium nutriculum, Strain RCC3387" /LENGTH=387 /DNA_ID=CAMNT_0044289867 /DNA_START=52 /DNA_END=1215 /DNA_ORIENTATION=+
MMWSLLTHLAPALALKLVTTTPDLQEHLSESEEAHIESSDEIADFDLDDLGEFLAPLDDTSAFHFSNHDEFDVCDSLQTGTYRKETHFYDAYKDVTDDKKFGESGFGQLSEVQDKQDKSGRTWVSKRIVKDEDWKKTVCPEKFVLEKKLAFNCWVRDVFEDTGRTGAVTGAFRFVMPMYEGGDLFQKVGKMNVAEVRAVGRQIALGLWALHRHGIIHRDVKPENVVVRAGEHVALIDYGSAQVGQAAGCGHQIKTAACSNQDVGTNGYLSPAADKGQPYSYETDWWSFGVTLKKLWQQSDGQSHLLLEDLLNLLTDANKFAELAVVSHEKESAWESKDPSKHPVLRHRFWFEGPPHEADPQLYVKFWREVCEKHAEEPEEQCQELMG